ncbi:hypothetical protein [Streptomyces sp. RS2]|uniref:hypothetical protein n=1 Tax=Streptomyces sp. RS2 TaxID=1451205 RepID=UPI0027E378BF|nr:hypothetical protein [Streptomyces sp. RS2]
MTTTEFGLLQFSGRNRRRVPYEAQNCGRVCTYDLDGQADVLERYISHLWWKTDAGSKWMIQARLSAGYLVKPVAL